MHTTQITPQRRNANTLRQELPLGRLDAPVREYINLQTLQLIRSVLRPSNDELLVFREGARKCPKQFTFHPTTKSSLTELMQIGTNPTFTLIFGSGEYAVWRKQLPGSIAVTYLIGHWPPNRQPDARPASVLAEFTDEASAVQALQRWGQDPRPPAFPVPRRVRLETPVKRKPGYKKPSAPAQQYELPLHDPRRFP